MRPVKSFATANRITSSFMEEVFNKIGNTKEKDAGNVSYIYAGSVNKNFGQIERSRCKLRFYHLACISVPTAASETK